MLDSYQTFYQRYMRQYHYVKALYLKRMLEELNVFIPLVIGDEEFSKTDEKDFRLNLKLDLRQNYFHAIETLFELIFAFVPEEDADMDEFNDFKILRRLTASEGNYQRIQAIAKDSAELAFLDRKIKSSKFEDITVGHYLFYFGVFSRENFSQEVFDGIKQSVDAIKKALYLLAKDFSDRSEYNSYKHGLRVLNLSLHEELGALSLHTKEFRLSIGVSDNLAVTSEEIEPIDYVSFYSQKGIKKLPKDSVPDMNCIALDSERDFQMTALCSEVMKALFSLRIKTLHPRKDEEEMSSKSIKDDLRLFDEVLIETCSRSHVTAHRSGLREMR